MSYSPSTRRKEYISVMLRWEFIKEKLRQKYAGNYAYDHAIYQVLRRKNQVLIGTKKDITLSTSPSTKKKQIRFKIVWFLTFLLF